MCEQIMTSTEGSFARFTILTRVPEILENLIANNSFTTEVENGLKELLQSVPSGKLIPLNSDYPFAKRINQELSVHPEYNWLNAPFLFIENYLYHRISEICGFFTNGYDYFHYKKEAEFRKGLDKFSDYLRDIDTIDSFQEICLMNLMGNKADLSQNASYYAADATSELLIDHRNLAASKIKNCTRVDLVLDNAGEELFFDLLLAWWLLSHTEVRKVKLHFKILPYFVSDALESDYRFLLSILSEKDDTAWFTDAMNSLEDEGKLEIGAHPYFVNGELFSQMTSDLSEELSRSDLVIFKGDLNYRRLVGDNYHPCETKTSAIINYFQTDILISRILKSEVMVGLAPDTIPHREKTDWMFSGKYGQIEYVSTSRNKRNQA